MKIKGKWRVASDEWRDGTPEIPTPPGNADGCENKRFAGKAIRIFVKTKGEEKWVVGGE